MVSDVFDRTCRGIKLPQDRRKPRRRRITPEDLERLTAVLQRIGEARAKHAAPSRAWFGPLQAVMMWVGVATGLRWAEVAGRQVRDLNLLAAEISVTRQLGPQSQPGRAQISSGRADVRDPEVADQGARSPPGPARAHRTRWGRPRIYGRPGRPTQLLGLAPERVGSGV
jgi:hypothetical protein